MRKLLLFIGLSISQLGSASTVIYDFSGTNPLESFNHDGSSYQVTNEQLLPSLVTDFYNTTLSIKTPVIGGAGNQITLTADFLYDTALINPTPAEVAGLSLFINSDSTPLSFEPLMYQYLPL